MGIAAAVAATGCAKMPLAITIIIPRNMEVEAVAIIDRLNTICL